MSFEGVCVMVLECGDRVQSDSPREQEKIDKAVLMIQSNRDCLASARGFLR